MRFLYKKRFIFVLIFCFIGACRLSKERPILEVPDGNKERIKKEILTGTNKAPKYWISQVTVIDQTFGKDFYLMDGVVSGLVTIGYFDFEKDKVKFNDVMTRQFLEKKEVAKHGQTQVNQSWPVRHSEFRLAEIDGYTTSREEENNYIPWNEKTYFTVDWSKAHRSEVDLMVMAPKHCLIKKASSEILSEREIPYVVGKGGQKKIEGDSDYISFVVEVEYEINPKCKSMKSWIYQEDTYTARYRYSFKKVEDPYRKSTNYKPYIYNGGRDPLVRKYGYFQTMRLVKDEFGQDANIFYMKRWNPNKKHIFYFSQEYPDEYKDIAHGVICNTNKIFAKQGLNNYPKEGSCTEDGSVLPAPGETCTKGICFELKENTGQKFGDIRYSFFHITKDKGVFGYGPSVANPATGEILSGHATASIHDLDWYLKYVIEDRFKRDSSHSLNKSGERIKNQDLKYLTSSLFITMKQILEKDSPKNKDHRVWTKTSDLVDEVRKPFHFLVSKLTYPRVTPYSISKEKVFSPFPKNLKNLLSIEDQNDLNQIEETIQNINDIHKDHEFCNYSIESFLSQIPTLLKNGFTAEELKKRILFNLISHEFGHVLNLRHNFYGSVDSAHYHEDLKTSSVMDYMPLDKEVEGPLKAVFAPYDVAALTYAYSYGNKYFDPDSEGKIKDISKEKNKHYLYCTDEDVSGNFLCNRWDSGDSPSKIMMSLIESYEEAYFLRNFRSGRAFWNTTSYPLTVLRNMMQIKSILPMLQFVFTEENMTKNMKDFKEIYPNHFVEYIQKDIKQAVRLSLAFYHSVIQEKDRKMFDSFYHLDGSIKQKGVLYDKYFAKVFLLGDSLIASNSPDGSSFFANTSYFNSIDSLESHQMIEQILEDSLTYRIDNVPFIANISKILYLYNVSNYYSRQTQTENLSEKVAVYCYTAKGLEEAFGIEEPKDVEIFRMSDLNVVDNKFSGTRENLGVMAYRDGNFYVSSSYRNKYAFSLIENMLDYQDSKQILKDDFYELYKYYHMIVFSESSPECENGN